MKTLVVNLSYFDKDKGEHVSFPFAMMCPFNKEPNRLDFTWRVIENDVQSH